MKATTGSKLPALINSGMVRPGDVFVVHSNTLVMRAVSWWPWYWNRANHIAVFTHTDEAGVHWATEARPGGVGDRNVATLGVLLTNADQPKTDEQRATILQISDAMRKTQYDWNAIEHEVFARLREHEVSWDMEWDGDRPPAHVICSSYAAYLYWVAHLTGPHSWLSTPADWARFIRERRWERFSWQVTAQERNP